MTFVLLFYTTAFLGVIYNSIRQIILLSKKMLKDRHIFLKAKFFETGCASVTECCTPFIVLSADCEVSQCPECYKRHENVLLSTLHIKVYHPSTGFLLNTLLALQKSVSSRSMSATKASAIFQSFSGISCSFMNVSFVNILS